MVNDQIEPHRHHGLSGRGTGGRAMIADPEVLVIGGGVIGVCTAYYLARSGSQVTLLEEHQIGGRMASSYGNIGLLTPSHSEPVAAPQVLRQGLRWLFNPVSPLYLKPRWDADLARWLLGFRAACSAARCAAGEAALRRWHGASLELYAELSAHLPPEVDYERKGGIYLYRDRREWERARARAARERADGVERGHADSVRQGGVEVELADGPERVLAWVPGARPAVVGATHYRADGRVIPDRFVRAMAAAAGAAGAQIHEQVAVFGLERSGARVSAVLTSRGVMRPQTVVLATGFLSRQLARGVGLRLPIEPAKGYSITVRRPAACPEIPLHLHEDKVVITPLGPDRMRIGGTLELAGDDRSVNLRRVAALQHALPRYLSGLEELEVLEIWRGMRPLSADTLPIIGRARGLDNLVLATGHGMIGVSLAPISGKVAAEVARGEPPSLDLGPLRADRY